MRESSAKRSSKRGNYEFASWLPAILDCLRALGGSAKPKEVIDWIERNCSVPADSIETTLKSGQSRFYNQVHWARQYLVWDGLLDDSRRGTWQLTPLGWRTTLDREAANELVRRRVRATRRDGSGTRPPTTPSADGPAVDESLPPDEAHDSDLLETLKGLSPYGFELICERLLREHGFEDVEVTQKSRDGGIDGFGVLRLSPFVSIKIAFQAKRYREVVSRSMVGEFRNALMGRAEKGVIITTGRYSRDAEEEANRPGVIPIELVDGSRLVELFEEKQLGVRPKQIFEIDNAFFDQFRGK